MALTNAAATISAEDVQKARKAIAAARQHLRRAEEALASTNADKSKTDGQRLNPGDPPHDLLELALAIITRALPRQLEARARESHASPQAWLESVRRLSCAPRAIAEPVATIVVMLAAVKFGLRHQLILQTETRLGLPHKRPIPQLDVFLDTLVSEMTEADRAAADFNRWLREMVSAHYPEFAQNRRLELPDGDHFVIPAAIAPIQPRPAPIADAAWTSPVDPTAALLIPPGAGWQITLDFNQILDNKSYPAYHGKHHSGIDIWRPHGFQAPVYAMRAGLVIDSLYLSRGFGHTVTVEHEDGSCLRYTHLDRRLAGAGERVNRGRQIGAIGKGAGNIYVPHLHLDMPRNRALARAGTYYSAPGEVLERFINPLSRMPAGL